ncbi:MAG: hypothetical protein K5923_00725 [Clostridia bacterium]|nr:hypothetical protein [Clostridia bacterium]
MLKRIYDKFIMSNEATHKKYAYYKIAHPILHKKMRIASWAYLSYLLAKHKVFKIPYDSICPESSFTKQPNLDLIKERISKADIISFDIFDTLILRKVNRPIDVFKIMAMQTDMVDFQQLRIEAENESRNISLKEKGSLEVNIFDIYNCIPSIFPSQKLSMVEKEFDIETQVCYANPYIKEVFNIALASQKPIIAVSDMYWPSKYLEHLLHTCGYGKFDAIYVSNEFGVSKHKGKLQSIISTKYPGKKIFHIGDSYLCDYYFSRKLANWDSIQYKNISTEGDICFRPNFNSLSGSIYNALVNAKLHNGTHTPGKFYEHGYTYGGFLSYGYCKFINSLTKDSKDTKILFTARDSKTFFDIYKKYYNTCASEYFYCSREALIKACLPYASDLYFDIMFVAKTYLQNKISICTALDYAELGFMSKYLIMYGLDEESILDKNTIHKLQELFYDHIEEAIISYKTHHDAAIAYISTAIKNYSSVYIIDLGWRGAVYTLLSHLIHSINPTVHVIGLEIGATNSPIPEVLINESRLIPYVFSQGNNPDLQINIKHVMLVETLFSSEQPSCTGYTFKNNIPLPVFGDKENANTSTFEEINKGILDFCDDFNNIETSLGLDIDISGRDAYLPLHIINYNRNYNIKLFRDLYATDLSASKAEKLTLILKKYGY